ncbi:MAG: cyclic nucleotide-binding domain-containing protein [Rhizobiales bacterium]|nr:cyclic nucleotide-binding domain-containing protein [Hyphomicrobiales bacterium]
MNWIEIAGYLASALVLATFCMKTMIPLRAAAICSNVAFIVYGFYEELYPVLMLHAILLPLNTWRALQMLRLIRRVEAAAKGDLSVDWLRPFMKEAHLKAGEILFSRGDHADRLYMIIQGDVYLEQIDHTLRPGDLFGETGLFAADHTRTQTARARTDVELLWISEAELAQICFQNPGIAFYFLKLTTNRLLANAARAAASAAPEARREAAAL